jgi:hypothetical protein
MPGHERSPTSTLGRPHGHTEEEGAVPQQLPGSPAWAEWICGPGIMPALSPTQARRISVLQALEDGSYDTMPPPRTPLQSSSPSRDYGTPLYRITTPVRQGPCRAHTVYGCVVCKGMPVIETRRSPQLPRRPLSPPPLPAAAPLPPLPASASPQQTPKLNRAILRATFSKVDQNGDGTVGRHELAHSVAEHAALAQLLGVPPGASPAAADAHVERVFRDLDTDGDYGVSFEEFARHLDRIVGAHAQGGGGGAASADVAGAAGGGRPGGFAAMDQDGDGVLSRAEFRRGLFQEGVPPTPPQRHYLPEPEPEPEPGSGARRPKSVRFQDTEEIVALRTEIELLKQKKPESPAAGASNVSTSSEQLRILELQSQLAAQQAEQERRYQEQLHEVSREHQTAEESERLRAEMKILKLTQQQQRELQQRDEQLQEHQTAEESERLRAEIEILKLKQQQQRELQQRDEQLQHDEQMQKQSLRAEQERIRALEAKVQQQEQQQQREQATYKEREGLRVLQTELQAAQKQQAREAAQQREMLEQKRARAEQDQALQTQLQAAQEQLRRQEDRERQREQQWEQQRERDAQARSLQSQLAATAQQRDAADLLFDVLDSNQDGQLSSDEFKGRAEAAEATTRETQRRLTEAELRAAQLAEENERVRAAAERARATAEEEKERMRRERAAELEAAALAAGAQAQQAERRALQQEIEAMELSQRQALLASQAAVAAAEEKAAAAANAQTEALAKATTMVSTAQSAVASEREQLLEAVVAERERSAEVVAEYGKRVSAAESGQMRERAELQRLQTEAEEARLACEKAEAAAEQASRHAAMEQALRQELERTKSALHAAASKQQEELQRALVSRQEENTRLARQAERAERRRKSEEAQLTSRLETERCAFALRLLSSPPPPPPPLSLCACSCCCAVLHCCFVRY